MEWLLIVLCLALITGLFLLSRPTFKHTSGRYVFVNGMTGYQAFYGRTFRSAKAAARYYQRHRSFATFSLELHKIL